LVGGTSDFGIKISEKLKVNILSRLLGILPT
jgi:hypothetical protein